MTTFVLVHGAWQGGWIWKAVASDLRAKGHRVYAPSLDGCAERRHSVRPGITTETQAQELADFLFFEDLSDVVLVGTSVGGMVACKTAELARERIDRLVFLDALVLFDGESQSTALSRPTSIVTDLTIATKREHSERLLASLDPKTREWALDRLGPHPIGAVGNPVSLPNFWKLKWKADVIWCRKAPNPGEAHLRRAADALGARWLEIDDWHYPMLSSPLKVSELLQS